MNIRRIKNQFQVDAASQEKKLSVLEKVMSEIIAIA
jgi:hypothetical protein